MKSSVLPTIAIGELPKDLGRTKMKNGPRKPLCPSQISYFLRIWWPSRKNSGGSFLNIRLGRLATGSSDSTAAMHTQKIISPLIGRIRPRRSGLEWQESLWNRLKREKQMMSDANRLVRPGAVAQGAQPKRPPTSIAKLPERVTMRLQDATNLSSRGTTRNRAVLGKARAV